MIRPSSIDFFKLDIRPSDNIKMTANPSLRVGHYTPKSYSFICEEWKSSAAFKEDFEYEITFNYATESGPSPKWELKISKYNYNKKNLEFCHRITGNSETISTALETFTLGYKSKDYN